MITIQCSVYHDELQYDIMETRSEALFESVKNIATEGERDQLTLEDIFETYQGELEVGMDTADLLLTEDQLQLPLRTDKE